MKKLLIRAIGILPPKKGEYIQGIGRSNIELLKGLIRLSDPDIELSFYCNQAKRPFYNFPEWPIKHHKYVLPHGLNLFCNIEPLWRKYVMKYDLFHITDNFDRVDKNENFVVTIHDMIRYKESPLWKNIFEDVGRYSKGIVTCSEFSKIEIVNTLHVNPDKVDVIYWGINHSIFYPRDIAEINILKNKLGIPHKYFFACSCAHPRKNAKDILFAFNSIANDVDDCSLVLAWSNVPEELKNKYKHLIDSKKLFFLDYVNDDDLAILYSGALASFLVSSLEGFGFPILESMACGTQCITCKNSSLTEIGSDKAYFVEEHNIESIAKSMLFFISNGKGNIKEYVDYANTFSWENTARKYLEFYKKYI